MKFSAMASMGLGPIKTSMETSTDKIRKKFTTVPGVNRISKNFHHSVRRDGLGPVKVSKTASGGYELVESRKSSPRRPVGVGWGP